MASDVLTNTVDRHIDRSAQYSSYLVVQVQEGLQPV